MVLFVIVQSCKGIDHILKKRFKQNEPLPTILHPTQFTRISIIFLEQFANNIT